MIYWSHRGVWMARNNFYTVDGAHCNRRGEYKLFHSLRGAILKSMWLFASAEFQKHSTNAAPHSIEPLTNSFNIDFNNFDCVNLWLFALSLPLYFCAWHWQYNTSSKVCQFWKKTMVYLTNHKMITMAMVIFKTYKMVEKGEESVLIKILVYSCFIEPFVFSLLWRGKYLEDSKQPFLRCSFRLLRT